MKNKINKIILSSLLLILLSSIVYAEVNCNPQTRTISYGDGICENTVTEYNFPDGWAQGCSGGRIAEQTEAEKARCEKYGSSCQEVCEANCGGLRGGAGYTLCNRPFAEFINRSICEHFGGTWYGLGQANMARATTEICDGIDNDCDGKADEGNVCDADGDGFLLYFDINKIYMFNDLIDIESIPKPNTPRYDCDDNDSNINPDAKERFNGKDDDCDGEVDEGLLWKQEAHNSESFCTMNGILNCTIYGNNPIEVYQNIGHLIPGDYIFSLDHISDTWIEDIKIIIDGIDECDSLTSCEFQIDEINKENKLVLVFNDDAAVDNATLQLTSFDYGDFDFSTVNMEQFVSTTRPVSCCPSDYCWNGEECIDSAGYMENTTKVPLVMDGNGNGYRCIMERDENGVETGIAEWTYSEKKTTPFGLKEGYCSYPEMCLVSRDWDDLDIYNASTPYYGCAKPNEFVANTAFDYVISPSNFGDINNTFKDYYCNRGSWTSRTKLLAMTLMEIGTKAYEDHGSNFMLLCDRPENSGKLSSLNFYNNIDLPAVYFPISLFDNMNPSKNLENVFNNFCTLIIDTHDNQDEGDTITNDVFDFRDTVIIGSSMNRHFKENVKDTPIEEYGFYPEELPTIDDMFFELFDTNCNGSINEDDYYSRCSDNFYYNNNTWTFIYTTDNNFLGDYSVELKNNTNPLEYIIRFFKNIINYFKNLVRNIIAEEINGPSIDETYLAKEDLYTRAYYSKVGDKEIQAVAQKGWDLSTVYNSNEMVDYAYFKFVNYNTLNGDKLCVDSEMKGRDVLNIPFEPGPLKERNSIILDDYTTEYICENTIDQDTNDQITNIVVAGTNIDSRNNEIDGLWYALTAKTRLQVQD